MTTKCNCTWWNWFPIKMDEYIIGKLCGQIPCMLIQTMRDVDVSTTDKICPVKINIYPRDVQKGYTTVLMFKQLTTHVICGTNLIFYQGTLSKFEFEFYLLSKYLFKVHWKLLFLPRLPTAWQENHSFSPSFALGNFRMFVWRVHSDSRKTDSCLIAVAQNTLPSSSLGILIFPSWVSAAKISWHQTWTEGSKQSYEEIKQTGVRWYEKSHQPFNWQITLHIIWNFVRRSIEKKLKCLWSDWRTSNLAEYWRLLWILDCWYCRYREITSTNPNWLVFNPNSRTQIFEKEVPGLLILWKS